MSDEEVKEFNGYTHNFGYVSVTDLMNYCSNVGSIDCNDIARFPKADVRENSWIPVTEKLPEDGVNVLFCDIDDDVMIGYRVKGRPDTHFSQDGTYEDMKNVRAWMPLPEPYKAESEDRENETDN